MPVVASIEPASQPVGPPADVRLHVYGSGFEATSQIRFGTVLERTDYHGPGEVSTIITGGLFPSPDPAVPVSVRNADSSESNVVTFAFVVIPTMPIDGSVIADLDNLRLYVGARSSQDDVLLQQRLYVATEYVYERCYPDHRGHPNVQEAILLLASRLYKRRQAPEGQAGFTGAGFVGLTAETHIVAVDPDIEALLDRHLDWSTFAGIA